MKIEAGKFYFIKDSFFEKVKDKELLQNKSNGNKRPCYFCFKDIHNNNLIWFVPISSKIEKYKNIYIHKLKSSQNRSVDTIVFGKVNGVENVFLIQNMFPCIEKYVSSQFIRKNVPVIITKSLQYEIFRKANKIILLVEKGYSNLVFPNVIKIKEIMLSELKEKS